MPLYDSRLFWLFPYELAQALVLTEQGRTKLEKKFNECHIVPESESKYNPKWVPGYEHRTIRDFASKEEFYMQTIDIDEEHSHQKMEAYVANSLHPADVFRVNFKGLQEHCFFYTVVSGLVALGGLGCFLFYALTGDIDDPANAGGGLLGVFVGGCALVYWWFSFQRLRLLNTLCIEVHGVTLTCGLGSKMGNPHRENLNEDDPEFKNWYHQIELISAHTDVDGVIGQPDEWQDENMYYESQKKLFHEKGAYTQNFTEYDHEQYILRRKSIDDLKLQCILMMEFNHFFVAGYRRKNSTWYEIKHFFDPVKPYRVLRDEDKQA